MQCIKKIFETKYGGLAFALIGGFSYFVIILDFILRYTKNGGLLLGFFFFPAIICGTGLVLLKTVKLLISSENFGKICILTAAHALLFAISLIFLFDIISRL